MGDRLLFANDGPKEARFASNAGACDDLFGANNTVEMDDEEPRAHPCRRSCKWRECKCPASIGRTAACRLTAAAGICPSMPPGHAATVCAGTEIVDLSTHRRAPADDRRHQQEHGAASAPDGLSDP